MCVGCVLSPHVTYFGKRLGTRSLAAFMRLELFRVYISLSIQHNSQ
ncbi:hypothetical protein BN1200_530233 [Klebsiella variicola]|nr:hypothetical protein BN1200_530233 [Klebsiella variicola]